MDNRSLVHVLRETSNLEDKSAWAPHGAGGAWRRRQIDGILRRNGVEPINLEGAFARTFGNKLVDVANILIRFSGKITASREALTSAAYTRALYRHNTRRPGLAPVCVLECGIDPIAIRSLKEGGFRVIVSLISINSLWLDRPSPVSGPYPQMFIREIESLLLADAVFSISREELWLLTNLGVMAKYLPYFPDSVRELSLFGERKGRPLGNGSGRPEFLICATRGNTDTVESFREHVDWITAAYPEGGPTFHVTGNQTEAVRGIWSDPRFVFHGTCSDDAFSDIKRRCRALCLHQQKGLGAVTRIPDMVLSGLRVISNGVAARSFLDMEGVHIYDTPMQFRNLLERDFPMPPIPQRPTELEDAFFASLSV